MNTSCHKPSQDEVQPSSSGSIKSCSAGPDSAEGFTSLPAEFCIVNLLHQLLFEYFHTVPSRKKRTVVMHFLPLKLISKLIWWILIVPEVHWSTAAKPPAGQLLAVIMAVATGQQTRDQHHKIFLSLLCCSHTMSSVRLIHTCALS